MATVSETEGYLVIQLAPINNSANFVDPVAAFLKDGLSVKLGRQVKCFQDKLVAAGGTLHSPVDISIENESSTSGIRSAAASPENDAKAELKQEIAIVSSSSSPTKSTENIWFKSKVVSRIHAEVWLREGQVYLKDTGSSSGTFLNKARLSTAGKMSRPYPIRTGDIVQLGVDYQGRTEDVYRAVELQVTVDWGSSTIHERVPRRFRFALKSLLQATNPYSTSNNQTPEGSVDCCICISGIGPFQALFIAPCSHCFHFKCMKHILKECIMFPCPVCRQVANLDASVSMESLFDANVEGKDEDSGLAEEIDHMQVDDPSVFATN